MVAANEDDILAAYSFPVVHGSLDVDLCEIAQVIKRIVSPHGGVNAMKKVFVHLLRGAEWAIALGYDLLTAENDCLR